MKVRNLLCLILAAALLLTALAACGSSADPAAASESAATSPEASASAEPSEEAAPSEEASVEPEPERAEEAVVTSYELPLFPGEDVRFSMWISFSDNMSTFMPNGFVDNHGYQKSVEMTGVNIDFREVPTTNNTEMFNIMIASGDYPDIITGIDMLWTGSYDSAIEQDIFIDLTEMIENYMPVYKSIYDDLDDSVKRDLHTDAGNFPKLLSIDFYPDGATEGAFIRADYLDAVGMDMPVTYDDLYNVLSAFKTELGLAQPLMLPAGIVHTSNSLCSGYDVNGCFSTFPTVAEPYYMVDGEVKYGIVEEGYKQYISMIAQYYQEGLIDPDFITKNTNPMGSEYIGSITSGDAGIFFGETNLVPNYYDGQSFNADFEIVPMPEIVQEAGQTTHFATETSPIGGRVSNIVVTTACEDIEKLGKYLDFFFTEEGALLVAMGVEGDGYVWDENGNLAYAEAYLNAELTETEKPTLFVYSVLPMLTPDTPSSYTMDVQFTCADVWDSNADTAYNMPNSISLTTDEQDEYYRYYTDIQTTIEENISKFVVGDRDMSEWDAFVEQLWSMGLQNCIDIKQAAVNRYFERAA